MTTSSVPTESFTDDPKELLIKRSKKLFQDVESLVVHIGMFSTFGGSKTVDSVQVDFRGGCVGGVTR